MIIIQYIIYNTYYISKTHNYCYFSERCNYIKNLILTLDHDCVNLTNTTYMYIRPTYI